MMQSRHLRLADTQLRELEERLPLLSERLAIPFVYRGKGYYKSILPQQHHEEIQALYAEVCERKPRRVLEIGTARGGTLYLWAQAAADDAVIVSVDLFESTARKARLPLYQGFARRRQTIHAFAADSHQNESLEKVRKLLCPDGTPVVDYAFIDGDHSYAGVKQDFEMFGPLVRPGGLIAFHDIRYRPDIPNQEVYRFWQELVDSGKYKTREIVASPETGPIMGIGLIEVA